MFDPAAARRRKPGMRRGQRLRMVVGLGLGVGVIALIALQKWYSGGEHETKTPLVIEASFAPPPKYEFKDPPPPPAVVQAALPVQPIETPPALQAPEIEPAPAPAETQPRQAPQRQERPRPKKISFDVTPPPQEEDQGDWFKDGMRPMLAKGCALRPGANIINAALNTVVESEIAGPMIATVSSPVYSQDAGYTDRVLIPAGTKLVGLYNSDLTLGSRRLGMRWTQATMPSGKQVTLDNADGMDIAGSNGVGGTVTTAWGQVIATAALFSVFDVAQRAFVSDGSYQGDMAEAASSNFAKTGQQVVKQMLEQAVKIRIPAATQIIVSFQKTIRVC